MEFLAGIAGLEADFTGIRCFDQDFLIIADIIIIIAGNTINIISVIIIIIAEICDNAIFIMIVIIIAGLEADFTGIRN